MRLTEHLRRGRRPPTAPSPAKGLCAVCRCERDDLNPLTGKCIACEVSEWCDEQPDLGGY